MTWTCALHGPLRYRFALDRWECPGFDGEGCTVITSEQEDGSGYVPGDT
jgi:hypothetical protein